MRPSVTKAMEDIDEEWQQLLITMDEEEIDGGEQPQQIVERHSFNNEAPRVPS